MPNRLLHFWPATTPGPVAGFAILETPCFPCAFYYGPVHHEGTGTSYPANNATHNWHRTEAEALEVAHMEGREGGRVIPVAPVTAPGSTDLLERALVYVETFQALPATATDRADLAHAIRNALHVAAMSHGEPPAATLSPALFAAASDARDILARLLEADDDGPGDELIRVGPGLVLRLNEALNAAPLASREQALEDALREGADFLASLLDVAPPESALDFLGNNGEDVEARMRAALDGKDAAPAADCSTEAQSLYRELLQAYGGDAERLTMFLDDMTHDAQIANASDVNNEGGEAQVAALLKAGIHASTIRDMAGRV